MIAGMRFLKAFAALAVALTATPLAVGQFAREVPTVVPSVEGWERIAGELHLENPRRAVRYEFYVNPARLAIYEVVRYRVTSFPEGGERRSRVTEKLQWDRDGRDLRRFECVASVRAGAACAWHEMEKGGAAYLREAPFLTSLYFAHNRQSRFARKEARK